jgi:hypothetical protein
VSAQDRTTALDWARLFAQELGTPPPSEEEINDLLVIAGLAAHASERTAAPLSTWLVGRAGIGPGAAKEAAARLAAMLDRSDP